MALATYADLLAALPKWLKPNTTLESAETDLIPDYITLAEAEFNKVLLSPKMDAIDALTITDGVATVPTGCLSVRRIQLTQSPWSVIAPVDIQSPAAYNGSTSATPAEYEWVGSQFIFNPPLSATASIRTRKALTPLSSGVNWLYAEHPDLYLYGSMIQANTRYIDEEQLGLAQARYDRGLTMLNNLLILKHSGGMQTRPSAGVV